MICLREEEEEEEKIILNQNMDFLFNKTNFHCHFSL